MYFCQINIIRKNRKNLKIEKLIILKIIITLIKNHKNVKYFLKFKSAMLKDVSGNNFCGSLNHILLMN